jgi:hypothetical protein
LKEIFRSLSSLSISFLLLHLDSLILQSLNDSSIGFVFKSIFSCRLLHLYYNFEIII